MTSDLPAVPRVRVYYSDEDGIDICCPDDFAAAVRAIVEEMKPHVRRVQRPPFVLEDPDAQSAAPAAPSGVEDDGKIKWTHLRILEWLCVYSREARGKGCTLLYSCLDAAHAEIESQAHGLTEARAECVRLRAALERLADEASGNDNGSIHFTSLRAAIARLDGTP